MALKIVRSDPTITPAIHQFNERMERGGSRWKFYASDQPSWLPFEAGATAWREHYVLIDEASGCVRGGYVLKHEAFLLDGVKIMLAHQQGPVAESVVEPSLRGLGLKMVNDALGRQPLQTGWGATIRKGWEARSRPALVHVLKKGAFIRGATALRRRKLIARAMDAASSIGLAQAGLAIMQMMSSTLAGQVLPRGVGSSLKAQEEPKFGDWADEVWELAKAQYRLVAVRDAEALNRAMPTGAWPDAIPLKVEYRGRVIGWAAIRDNHLEEDPLFGDLRVGSIVDALALPGEEAKIVAAAKRHLKLRGVTMVGAIFSHERWIAAFRRNGFIAVPDRRGVGFSPALVERGGGLDRLLTGAHLTLIDADGPRIF